MQRNFPGKHAITLFFVAVLLFFAFLFDEAAHQSELVDLVYLIPIITAAFFLLPLEALGIGMLATIFELFSENPSFEKPTQDLWTVSGIAVFSVVIAVGAAYIRRRVHPWKIAQSAIDLSQVAYAEFKFPSCSLAGHNEAFLEMAPLREGGRTLFDYFPKATAEKLVNLLVEAGSSGTLSESMSLSFKDEEGGNTFWLVDFIPISGSETGKPRSVVMLAYEKTESVQRTRIRDAAIEIATQVMSSMELDRILPVALSSLASIAEVDSGGICLIENGEWVGVAGYGEHSDEMVRSMRIPFDDFHSGVIATGNKRALVAEDAANDQQCNPRIIEQLKIKSAMIVPLVTGNQTIGVAWLSQTDRTRHFTEEQVNFCTVIGSQVAAAISNAVSFEKERSKSRELAWIKPLREVTAACSSSGDIETIAQQALDSISKQINCKTATIFYLDDEINALVKIAAIGHPREVADELNVVSLDRDGLFVVQAANKRVMMIHDAESAEDMSDDQRHILESLGAVRSRRIYMPLINKEEVVGCLCFSFPLDRTFSTIGLDVLNTIGNQLALTIDNWRLMRQAV